MKLFKIAMCITLTTLLVSSSFAAKKSDELKETLFGDIKAKLENARLNKADILSPENFSKAERAYNTAIEYFKEGKSLSEIKKNIRVAESLISKVGKNLELARLTLGKLIAARENAIVADAPTYALDNFKKGENLLIRAAKEVESGDVNRARKIAEKAEPVFRKAEKSALKEGLLGDVKELKKRSKKEEVDDYAPKVLKDADKKFREVQTFVSSKTYNVDTAKKKADETRYQYEHALELAKHVKDAKKKRMSREDMFLDFENKLGEMSKRLGLPRTFNKGITYQYDAIIAALERNQKDREDLNQRFMKAEIEYQNRIAELNDQIMTKDKEVAKLKGKTEEEAERLNTLRQKLEKENREKEKYETVKSLFTSSEGKVLKDGSHIILQLYGLTFPSGRSTVGAENYDLLAKVQKSIREYPNAYIIVEGHTDSLGDKKFNEILSEERAKSIKKYFIANNTVSKENISAVGYGSSRPVASNKTREGRAKNRRIDIIIKAQ